MTLFTSVNGLQMFQRRPRFHGQTLTDFVIVLNIEGVRLVTPPVSATRSASPRCYRRAQSENRRTRCRCWRRRFRWSRSSRFSVLNVKPPACRSAGCSRCPAATAIGKRKSGCASLWSRARCPARRTCSGPRCRHANWVPSQLTGRFVPPLNVIVRKARTRHSPRKALEPSLGRIIAAVRVAGQRYKHPAERRAELVDQARADDLAYRESAPWSNTRSRLLPSRIGRGSVEVEIGVRLQP